jgi:hypothetical protein
MTSLRALPEVAREDEALAPAGDEPGGRARDVAGGRGRRRQGAEPERGVVADRLEALDCRLHVVLVVEGRLGLPPLAPVSLVVLAVQLRGVEQEVPGELTGRGQGVDGPRVAALHQERQPARVVEVGVGEEDCVEAPGLEAERLAVSLHERPRAWKRPQSRRRRRPAISRRCTSR